MENRDRFSTSKPFLAIFTISSHLVTLGVESFIKLICILVFYLASSKGETIQYVIIYVSLIIF